MVTSNVVAPFKVVFAAGLEEAKTGLGVPKEVARIPSILTVCRGALKAAGHARGYLVLFKPFSTALLS